MTLWNAPQASNPTIYARLARCEASRSEATMPSGLSAGQQAKVKQIAGQLTEAQQDALLSMEWTGEYYEPPATERKSLAALGLLDHIYDYSVTYEGELVRAALAGKAEQ